MPETPPTTTPDARLPSPGVPLTVWLLGLTSFFTDVGSELIFPLLPEFIAALGGLAWLGLIEGVAEATAALLKIPAGVLADRVSRRLPLVLTGYGLAGAVRPLMAFATAPWHAVVVRVTDRVGKGLRSAPRDALIADVAPAGQTGRAFGVHSAMDHAGAILGPLLAAGLLGAGVAVPTIFALAAIPGALAVASLLLVREPPRAPRPVTVTGGAREVLPKRLRSFIAIVALFALANSTDAFLLVRARELGTTPALIPVLWATLHVVRFASSWRFGPLADRRAPTTLIVLGMLTHALGYLALGLAGSAWQAWLAILFYGLAAGLTVPAEKALLRSLAPPSARGRAFGWYHGATGLLAVPAGLLTGLLWTGASPQVALWTSAAMALVAALLLQRWSRAG